MTPSRIAISYTRFSSAKQADGDSDRRQVQLADAYAARHGLTIDQDLRFHDDGKSAFDSTNLHRGALGEFLKLVRAGKIPQGAVLLVENFDRLSRAAPREAYKTFDEIIDAGLTIVTLHNEQKFNRDEVEKNPFLLFSVFIEYIRARSESVAKSKRIKEVWGEKKKQAKATGTVMTRKTPYWIKAKADKSGFELIPERAAVVMRLVEASEKGTGNNTLIRQLHADGVEAWSKSGGWQPSYMQKLLRSPALYGAIRLNDEIVKGYYPALIDEDRFHHLQSLRSDRATTQCTSGRGKTLSNLFSGRLKCGYCGFSMNISGYKEHARTPTRKGYERKYVGCHGARTQEPNGCKQARIWFMDELEPKLLLWITKLDFAKIVGDDGSKLNAAKQVLAGLQGRLSECDRKAQNIGKAIEDGDAPKTLVDRLKVLEGEQSALKAQVREQQDVVNSLEAQRGSGKDRMAAFLKVMRLLKQADDPLIVKGLRQQLAALISTVVEKVEMYPAGPTVNGSKADRYMVATLKNGQRVEIDDSDDGDEAYQIDLSQTAVPWLVDPGIMQRVQVVAG